jgi:hypothetical protein
MSANSITTADRERYARTREVGERQAGDRSAVTAARYPMRRDAIELAFASGSTMTIPRGHARGIAHARGRAKTRPGNQ